LADAFTIGDCILLNAEAAIYMFAHGEVGIVRGDHPAYGSGTHDVADTDRRYVRLALVHPAAHGGIERDVEYLDKQLATGRFANGFLGIGPVAALRQTNRPRR